MPLHNRIDKRLLKAMIANDPTQRKTVSFYKYFEIDEPDVYRDHLYKDWEALGCLGRIYLANEGINAQMSVPEHNLEGFLTTLEANKHLSKMPIKYAVEDDGKSFYKLTIKVRPKIVADGLNDHDYDVTKVGKHLSPAGIPSIRCSEWRLRWATTG